MKNIHLISTEKESNLAIIDGKLLQYDPYVRFLSGTGVDGIHTDNQFIYITSTEKIKDGEYGLCAGLVRQGFKSEQAVFRMNDEQREAMVDLGGQVKAQVLKVCLTNDPRLIADGVQEIEKSVLISFAENSVNYLEVTKMLQARWGTEWHDLPNQTEGRDREGIYRHIYKLNFPQKEHQMLTDLKDYFKNTSPEKIQSDWDETEKYDRVGITVDDYLHQNSLLKEFEILEGITPEQFDEKDWNRFERFVKAKAEDEIGDKRIKTAEKLYTEEQLKEAFNAGMNCPIAGATFEEWVKSQKPAK